ncbi:chemotaxis protein CheR [Psychrobium sp. MM17-31]|uniref:CheR family methyltransferase n=1 Tax=Psychrobium sp. MM17-31 TaxID=2917758 RepID=UPI001EF63414|nr:CheR family methyltransferase [Psychrobium sp. MM17-31]MCG7531831.1 chemotaxis protein CheR [Psychrobium sp. MM17-31]
MDPVELGQGKGISTYSDTDREREFPYQQADFEHVRQKIYNHAGISLADHKKDLVYNRLVRRLRALKLDSFKSYIDYLDSSPAEMSQFVNAMTTNLTSFYRESHHFEYLSDTYIPQLAKDGQRSLRIWSSACSIGEEPYSIAISLLEAGIDPSVWDIKIYATDIDTDVLATAKAGIYNIDRVDGLSLARKKLGFLRGKGAHSDKVMVKPELKAMMAFDYCNLMENWHIQEKLDVIFCRNVMIYFDKETQTRLLNRMTSLLKPGGMLFIGHSESPARSMKDYQLLGRTMYQKR